MADVVGEYFQKRLQSTEMTRSIPVSSFYLGCDLDFVDDLNAVQEKILSLEKVKSPIFLMVGTIEPRKKHRDVLGAFERLWAQGVEARLVIVGGRDWMSGELLAEIAGHAEAERRLFLIRDASDSDLQWLYERAAALIMASEVEGFGLPIVEAKRAGLPVICSNIPVFAEIAAGEAEFFRLGNVDDLVRAILKRLASCGECATTSRGWISWRESARQLLELDFPGYAVGGLAVGEPHAVTCEMAGEVTSRLPEDRPRYLMGVGRPEQIADYVALGIGRSGVPR